MKTKQELKQAQYVTLQTVMIAAMNLKVGDTVKVISGLPRSDRDNPAYLGWNNSWTASMDKNIGNVYRVSDISETGRGVRLEGTGCMFPIFALQKTNNTPKIFKISSSYNAEIGHTGVVTVGCQTIPYALLKQIYDAATEAHNKSI